MTPLTAGATKAFSVVLCTVDRVSGALAAIRSIVRDTPSADVVVVDQGRTSELATLIARDPELAAVRLVDAPPRGLAAARNVGVQASRGAIIAFTDDDCECTPGWGAGLRAALGRDPRIGMVFGNVEAPGYDRTAGFIPAYRVPAFLVAEGVRDKARIEGIGACMAVRRDAWNAIDGFDESLGSGAPFRAGEDTDFAVRVLLAGWRVAETPDAAVVHHGFRTWAQGERLIAGYMYGLGATNLKMLRLGRVAAARPLVALAWRWLAGVPVVDLNQRPPRLPRLRAFLRGAVDGWRIPLTPGTGHFIRPASMHTGLTPASVPRHSDAA